MLRTSAVRSDRRPVTSSSSVRTAGEGHRPDEYLLRHDTPLPECQPTKAPQEQPGRGLGHKEWFG